VEAAVFHDVRPERRLERLTSVCGDSGWVLPRGEAYKKSGETCQLELARSRRGRGAEAGLIGPPY